MSNSKVEVTGILDQTTQSVIVLFLGVGILWHAFMIMPVSVRENSKSGIGPLATTRTRAVKSRMSWKTALKNLTAEGPVNQGDIKGGRCRSLLCVTASWGDESLGCLKIWPQPRFRLSFSSRCG